MKTKGQGAGEHGYEIFATGKARRNTEPIALESISKFGIADASATAAAENLDRATISLITDALRPLSVEYRGALTCVQSAVESKEKSKGGEHVRSAVFP